MASVLNPSSWMSNDLKLRRGLFLAAACSAPLGEERIFDEFEILIDEKHVRFFPRRS